MTPSDNVVRLEWALLLVRLPGRELLPAGVLVVDRESDKLLIKLRPTLEEGAPEEAAEFWCELPEDLLERSQDLGGAQTLNWLETTASHFVQLGARTPVESSAARETLELLYREHVASCEDRLRLDHKLRRGAAL